MSSKRWIPVLVLFLLGMALTVTAFAYEGYTENRYYYQQLDADERAVYDALASLSVPYSMDPVSVRVYMPESTTRYSSTDFILAAMYAYEYDNPADAAWISSINIKQPNGEDVPFEQLCSDTPDRLPAYDSLILEVRPGFTQRDLFNMNQYLEGMTNAATADMSRYDRAAYIQERVSANLQYDYDGRYEVALVASPVCITRGYAICEGFSKVYKILADKLSLPCVLSGGDGHMCVQVQMEDVGWYLVEPQGGFLLVGQRTVANNSMYWPQAGPAHWIRGEGHGAVLMPALPKNDYRGHTRPSTPVTPRPGPTPVDDSTLPFDMGIPQLNGRSFGPDNENIVIYWVQIQMKAAGYYTGDQWDETGNIGDHTQEEIRRFMRDCGYPYHTGFVDQTVVNTLASVLGSRLRPVYRGGYFRHMNALLNDLTFESCDTVYPNSQSNSAHNRTSIRWVQTALSLLGYYSGSIDGQYGSGTDSAVKAFQRDHGFQQRGYVTYGVARAMMEAMWQRGCDLSRLP